MTTNGSTEPGRVDAYAALPPLDEAPRGGWKAVYTIADRGNGRKYWLRIGIAFPNRDGSLNVRLDAMPLNGQIHIREPPPRDAQGYSRPGEGEDRGRDEYRTGSEFGTG